MYSDLEKECQLSPGRRLWPADCSIDPARKSGGSAQPSGVHIGPCPVRTAVLIRISSPLGSLVVPCLGASPRSLGDSHLTRVQPSGVHTGPCPARIALLARIYVSPVGGRLVRSRRLGNPRVSSWTCYVQTRQLLKRKGHDASLIRSGGLPRLSRSCSKTYGRKSWNTYWNVANSAVANSPTLPTSR